MKSSYLCILPNCQSTTYQSYPWKRKTVSFFGEIVLCHRISFFILTISYCSYIIQFLIAAVFYNQFPETVILGGLSSGRFGGADVRNLAVMMRSSNDGEGSLRATSSKRIAENQIPGYAKPRVDPAQNRSLAEAEDHTKGTLVTTLSSSGKLKIYMESYKW